MLTEEMINALRQIDKHYFEPEHKHWEELDNPTHHIFNSLNAIHNYLYALKRGPARTREPHKVGDVLDGMISLIKKQTQDAMKQRDLDIKHNNGLTDEEEASMDQYEEDKLYKEDNDG